MKRALSMILVLCLVLSLSVSAAAASGKITTTPTGYTKASDVEYVIYSGSVKVNSSTSSVKNIVVNWGARGEDCIFLSTYAQNYYSGSNNFDSYATMDGGTSTSNAYSSELYKALKNMMFGKHSNIISYKETRAYYGFTDCVSNDYSKISSFYSGKMANSQWNGSTYNREHTWPNSKGLGGSDEDDIMMLRPTITSENTDRGNTAYGESSGYYDPGISVRGDCARIVLYVYVRWGNTSNMWGKSGVIESLDILLKWMEEDPVDTWEMGRNDSVQSITGVRNVFVDYPELAWLLFGEEIPAGMSTPSGNASGSGSTTPTACSHKNTVIQNSYNATCSNSGYTGDTYCNDCKEVIATGTAIGKLAHTNANKDNKCDECGTSVTCEHGKTELRGAKAATCGASGNQDHTYCSYCGDLIKSGQTIPATGKHTFGQWTVTKEPTTTQTGSQERRCSVCDHTETAVIPTIDPPATEPSFPTEPSTPTEPSVPTEPSQPTEPSAPTEPSQPTEPSVPTEPSQPTEPSAPTEPAGCSHGTTIHRNASTATCTKDGYTGDTYCILCGRKIIVGTVIVATGHSNNNGDASCDTCGADLNCTHATTQLQGTKEATCGADGYTGDSVCVACGDVITAGQVIPATGDHHFGEWISNEDLSSRTCEDCGYAEIQYNTPTEPTETEPAPTETEPAPSETQPAPTQPSTAPTVPSEPSLAPSTQPATEESAAPSTTPVQPEPDFPMTPVIIGIVILAAAAIVILILKKKKG